MRSERTHPAAARTCAGPLAPSAGALLLIVGLALTPGARAQAPRRAPTPAPPTPERVAGAPAGDRAGDRAAPTPRRVAGRVVRPTPRGLVPVRGAWVTLHRVGGDSAGPLDSARTASDGHYAFQYRPFGAESAIYFVSASYGGIAYFTPPLRGRNVSGEDAEVTVFDTSSAPTGLGVRGRHVIVAAKDSTGRRTVIEVYELSNDSSYTLVGGGTNGDRPTWSTVLPAGAQNFRVGQGDVSPEAVTFDSGQALVHAPFAPGLKQLSFSYALPESRFPLSIPIGRETAVLEVLVEEPTAGASAPRLTEVNPVSVEGRNFKRFLGQDVPATGVLTVTVPRGASGSRRTALIVGLLGVLGAAMLLALARAAVRRPPGPIRVEAYPERPIADVAEGLAREIAELDAAFERDAPPGEEARLAYQRRREALKARLTEALAGRGAAR